MKKLRVMLLSAICVVSLLATGAVVGCSQQDTSPDVGIDNSQQIGNGSEGGDSSGVEDSTQPGGSEGGDSSGVEDSTQPGGSEGGDSSGVEDSTQPGGTEGGDSSGVENPTQPDDSGDGTIDEDIPEGGMLVKYIKGNKVIDSVILFEDTVADYTLWGADDYIVKDNTTSGFEFLGWRNQVGGGSVTSITYNPQGWRLVLDERAITYTLNVKYHALSDQVQTMTYDVVNGFSSFTPAHREYYTYMGIAYNGKTYSDFTSNGAFASAIIASGEKTLDVACDWDCIVEGFVFDFYAVANYERGGELGNWAIVDENGNFVEKENAVVIFDDVEGENYFDLTDNVYDYIIGAFSGLKTMNGDAVEFANRFTMEISVGSYQVGNLIRMYYPIDQVTFMTVIDGLEIQKELNSEFPEYSEISKLTFTFIFEVA